MSETPTPSFTTRIRDLREIQEIEAGLEYLDKSLRDLYKIGNVQINNDTQPISREDGLDDRIRNTFSYWKGFLETITEFIKRSKKSYASPIIIIQTDTDVDAFMEGKKHAKEYLERLNDQIKPPSADDLIGKEFAALLFLSRFCSTHRVDSEVEVESRFYENTAKLEDTVPPPDDMVLSYNDGPMILDIRQNTAEQATRRPDPSAVTQRSAIPRAALASSRNDVRSQLERSLKPKDPEDSRGTYAITFPPKDSK